MALEFLDLVETFRADEVSRERIFAGEGMGVRSARKGPTYARALAEAATLISNVYQGKTPIWRLQEAMTTSDFPLLMGDILDRQILGYYQETPAVYRNFCRIGSVRDFRTVKRFAVDGAEAVLDAVGEQQSYPMAALSETRYSYAVSKYGRRIPFSWEAIVNDDLDALKNIPERFGRAARRSESKFACGLYCGTTGPDSALYSVGNANIVTSNPVLSISALQTAFTVLAAQTDADGEPIYIDAVELVVPPALQVTAQNILNATELWLNEAGGVSNQQIHTVNWMRERVRLNVDPYIPIVASSSHGNTSWFLFAATSVGRPALEVGFLRGHEAPELFMKSPNATRVGGATADAMNGDFDTDSLEYKIRHVFGGTQMDPKMTVASNGSGS